VDIVYYYYSITTLLIAGKKAFMVLSPLCYSVVHILGIIFMDIISKATFSTGYYFHGYFYRLLSQHYF